VNCSRGSRRPWTPSRPRRPGSAFRRAATATPSLTPTWRTRGSATRLPGPSNSWESILRAHVRPVLGELPVSRWRLKHSRKVISNAQKTVRSVVRLGDIRTVMSGMRTIAWRQGWLDRSIDPLEGLDLPRQEELHGVGKGYVPEELRPERHQVDAMTRAADHLTVNGPEPLRRLPLFGTKIRVAGYGGLRLGEQNALRAIDIFFNRGHVSVNGSWTQPREADAKR
jgi:hypothetical protein